MEPLDVPATVELKKESAKEFDVLRMLAWAFLVEIVAYAMLAIGSLASTPIEGAWTIVTETQKGLMALMQINLGALAGVTAPRRG